jgi:hypothetical protein
MKHAQESNRMKRLIAFALVAWALSACYADETTERSEERRVGKEVSNFV